MVLELFTTKVCVLFYQLLLVVTLISSVPKGVGSAVQLWGRAASMSPDDLLNMKLEVQQAKMILVTNPEDFKTIGQVHTGHSAGCPQIPRTEGRNLRKSRNSLEHKNLLPCEKEPFQHRVTLDK